MRRLKGLYILDRAIYDLVYGPDVQQAISRHVEMIAPPQTGASMAQRGDLLDDVEVIFSGWGGPCFDERFFDGAPQLRAVFHAGGAPRLPFNAARRGVIITSAHVANSVPVAEYTLATILLSLKHGWHLIRQTRHEQTFPERNRAPGCYQKTVGIIGLGTIARLLLPLLKPFDLRVVAYDPFVTSTEAALLNVEMVSLEDLFKRSDVVTLHAAHTRDTEGMITGGHLASMQTGATFINTSRGALVRETELIQVAVRRPDLQFVLDVTNPEPPIAGSPLYTLPNVVLTPHIAGSAGGECRRMGHYLVEELERLVTGQPLKWAVPNPVLPGQPIPSLLLNSGTAGRPHVTVAGNFSLRTQIETLHAQCGGQ